MIIVPIEMGAFFPVLFYDGEQQLDIGTILITPTMDYKTFQSQISHKIGISSHQITTYFNPTPYLPDDFHRRRNRRRLRRRPVTNKFNFSLAMMDATASFFYVVLKRSRRLRRHPRQLPPSFDYNYDLVPLPRYPSPDIVDSLTLNSDGYNYLSSWYNTGNYYDGGNDDVSPDIVDSLTLNSDGYNYLSGWYNTGNYYNGGNDDVSPDIVDSLSLNSDGYNYLSGWYNAGNYYYGGNDDVDVDGGSSSGGVDGVSSSGGDDGGSSSGGGSSSVAFCDICFNDDDDDDDDTVSFHCCKNDPVTLIYRSPAGPIAPPSKSKTVRFNDHDF